MKSLYVLMITMIICVCFFASLVPISIAAQKSDALEYYSYVLDELEDSHMDGKVIEKCIERAKEKGYELKVEEKNNACFLVTLTYNIKLPIPGYSKTGTHYGYAR